MSLKDGPGEYVYLHSQGHSRLISTGSYIPSQRITAREVMEQFDPENRYGVSYNWLEKITGIKEKRVSQEYELPSHMAVKAAEEALERAKTLPSEIDVIIYAGVTRDYLEPATAHVVQAKLEALNATVFDVSNACNGFMNGIHIMDALIATGQARRGLVVCGEKGSLYTKKAIEELKISHDKQKLINLTAGLTLGDAGAAVVMGPKLGPDTGFMGFILQSQGQHFKYCTTGEPLIDGPLITDMPKILSESSKLLAAIYQEFMQHQLKWKSEELSWYIIHQVGASTFKLHYKKTGIPIDIMPKTVINLGNIVTATIPVNLHNIILKQEVKNGQKVYLSGVGSGVSISQAGLIWDAA